MMKIKLLKEVRIKHKEGDIVEVSPSEADFLIVNKAAELVEEKPTEPKKRKKTV